MQEPPAVAVLLEELASFPMTVLQAVSRNGIDWHRRPNETEWSLTELMCHLRDVEREVHQVRFRALMTTDNAFLPGATADDWVEQRRYQLQDGRVALADFIAARQETVQMLQTVDELLWQRRGRHAFFGPTTMHELLNLAVRHDQAHRQQLHALVTRENEV